MPVNPIALRFLDDLERAEARLLNWGLIDGFFSEMELEERARVFLAAMGTAGPYSEPWDLIEALLDARLVWRVPETERYRTRMAEAVRLFSRLRQIFPDARNEAWRAAPTLVADYRLIVRPRQFPIRNVDRDGVIGAIRAAYRLTTLQEGVIDALVGATDERKIGLAGFQVRATERVLRSAGDDRAQGTIVTAGTGSGKTLAFYLPAFTLIAERLSAEHWTQCLAIYPRNELLKDQLREALANARRIAATLEGRRKRRLVIGALYGDVPASSRAVMDASRSGAWSRITVLGQPAYVCPFVRCPTCGGDLVWLESDVTAAIERLRCIQRDCGDHVLPEEVRLTRERMLAEPPDVLFTSTEMVNQRLSSSRYAGLFGIGVRSERRPKLVLIDEVHAYEGVHGAQVALLLRRWRRAADARPHFVGLSATLADAARFFGDLVGLGQGDVTEVSPDTHEMISVGAEYMLALRGDPSSGTSLLSTTIQASMLLRRVLGTTEGELSGRRVFAFTDNLDVINRLFHSVLDAEGWDSWGRPNPRRAVGSLANLRSRTLPNARDRFEQGQNWSLVEDIGHVLAPGQGVRVGRTSSQDAGVDPDADIVVATAALEVGFDDPEVGGVLQHKAPHSPAAFLQRKGRAGRRHDMRPWTVVVLSDYGRDRAAYQSYDQLFSPTLPPRHLPLTNRAVLRIQAALALCDWLARQVPPSQGADPWSDFSQPPSDVSGRLAQQRDARQRLYARILRSLLEQRNVREEFAAFLARSLTIDEDEAVALLWEAPRAVLTEVAPTLLRRLETGWRRVGTPDLEPHAWRVPLPEFLPRALFGDLHVPDVDIRLPSIGRVSARSEAMPVAQALQEFAPGRVSKRFGVSQSRERHWIPPGDGGTLSVDTFCPPTQRQTLGAFRFLDGDGHENTVAVFRPYSLVVELTPLDVQQSSNSFLEWHAEVLPAAEGHDLDQPERGTRWTQVLKSVRVHAHHLGAPVELRRFSVGARATVGRGRQGQASYGLRFVSSASGSEEAVGLGFVADVDAVEVVFVYPTPLHAYCKSDAVLQRGLRTARFRDAVRTNPALDGVANTFQRDWLSQAYLCAVTADALRRTISLESAAEAVSSGNSTMNVQEALETILLWTESGDDDDDSQSGHGRPRRLDDLLGLLRNPAVLEVLTDSALHLWEPLDDGWDSWLRTRFKATLAAAMIEAAHSLCPRMSDDALVADLDALTSGDAATRLHDGEDRFWVAETTIGGGGFIEEFLARYAEDPRRYFRFLDASLRGSELETVSNDLARIVSIVAVGAEGARDLVSAFEAIRTSASHEETVGGLALLRTSLSRHGVLPSAALLVALNTRLIGPGSSAATDRFIARMLAEWVQAEDRLGVDVDARVFALVASWDDALEQALQVVPPGDSEAARANWRFGVLTGVFWPRGAALRSEGLQSRNPFEARRESDRLLVLSAVARPAEQVRLDTPDWFSQLSTLLLKEGTVELVASVEESQQLAMALLRLGAEPIDSEAILVHARVTGVTRDADQLKAIIELPEALQ